MNNHTPGPFQIAVIQMNPKRSAVAENLRSIEVRLIEAAERGAQLALFPECALSGYVFHNLEEAIPSALDIHSPRLDQIRAICTRMNIYAVVGLIEKYHVHTYNSAFLFSPDGKIQAYRKCHLPVLGIDRFMSQGDSLPIFDTELGRIGILICYDIRFPEAARTLTLKGADIILVPTNWPAGAESSPEFLTRARAWENRVWIAACDRVGTEEGTKFIGRSQIITPDGVILKQAGTEDEEMLIAEIDPNISRQKRIVIVPGEFELDPVLGRRPELYDL